MKKLIALLLAVVMVACVFAGCGNNKAAEIYMITDKGDINDKSFNQGTWEGIEAWAKKNDVGCAYLKPADATDAEYVNSIEQAINAGAKVIVTPGFLFEVPIYTVQELSLIHI